MDCGDGREERRDGCANERDVTTTLVLSTKREETEMEIGREENVRGWREWDIRGKSERGGGNGSGSGSGRDSGFEIEDGIEINFTKN